MSDFCFVLTMTNKIIDLDVQANDTVERLKALIADNTGIGVEHQHLRCIGYVLKDEETLSIHDVKEGGEIVLRLPGCPERTCDMHTPEAWPSPYTLAELRDEYLKCYCGACIQHLMRLEARDARNSSVGSASGAEDDDE